MEAAFLQLIELFCIFFFMLRSLGAGVKIEKKSVFRPLFFCSVHPIRDDTDNIEVIFHGLLPSQHLVGRRGGGRRRGGVAI